jgi:hypothetical protein
VDDALPGLVNLGSFLASSSSLASLSTFFSYSDDGTCDDGLYLAFFLLPPRLLVIFSCPCVGPQPALSLPCRLAAMADARNTSQVGMKLFRNPTPAYSRLQSFCSENGTDREEGRVVFGRDYV